ncbi:mandelate racemase/muconate lactonizing enzyme family protein [Fusibacter paucivorans]|uniref:Mandelate racemase/muconate lactonizing enzyme family protein n=1 Tax=Fusibacter paucivorans TaxID=76009 RepID=A0ABS5PSW4_9FIRM|nr:mandelate racemase/muconate lactonizing enzyme family protein [Fusibacter paucivorans]MBS7528183.1 mandelate racemase/muconate lactonizing enzyme family protein [Fusibacter paucivorans]
MKVTSIDIFALKPRYVAHTMRGIVCRINTDEGLYGYGEAALSYGKGSMAGFHMIKELAPLIIGQDPMRTEYLWESMLKNTFWGVSGGAVFYAAMSAIDIALMDIKGKALGVPCYQLLGGKQRDSLRAYASQLQLGWMNDDDQGFKLQFTPEDYAREAEKAVKEGYTAIKTDFLAVDGKTKTVRPFDALTGILDQETLRMGVERLRATREAVGPDVDIIVENHGNTDAISGTQFGRAIETYNVYYYEEATNPLNPTTSKSVSNKVKIPIANGERIFTRWKYLPFMLDDSIQVIQPEISNCGGLTECKKICDLAHIFDAAVQVHVCGSPISLAAALQVEAAIPNFLIHEHHVMNKMLFIRELGMYDMAPVNGSFIVPERPGIGQELSDYAIKTAYCETVK